MPIALLSVYNKTGIVEFAQDLKGLGWDLIASGGTAKALTGAEIEVRDVATLVGGGPILGHRVVTLSREVHAGLLAKDTPEDNQELMRLGVPRIDLVCVDLYPLQTEIVKPNSTFASVIEQTDIGGPTMLRSAAKGQRIVICDPADRQLVIDWLKKGQPDRENFIRGLAAKAEFVVANYCLSSAGYHSGGNYDGILGEKVLSCKYGENAWQTPAALFSAGSVDPLALDKFQLVAGTDPSYNNICDIDRLLQTMTHIAAVFELNRGKVPYIAVGVKHGNACGAAIGGHKIEVVKRMIEGDPVAIFGGLVMTNFIINEDVAEALLTYLMPDGQRRLLDGVIAPSFDWRVISMLQRKKDKCRLLENRALEVLTSSLDMAPRFRYVRGGFLRQPNYTFVLDLKDSRLEKFGGELSGEEENDLLLAWAVGSTSNSNTITLTRNGMLLGNGVGQQDRVGGCKLALQRAIRSRHITARAVAYSDSFFPFMDGPELLVEEGGIKTIFATSGSVNDERMREYCRSRGRTLYLIPDAVGRGFYGH